MIELCFNLWYYIDHNQNIVALAAKAYMLDGSDEVKAELLRRLSRHDYRTVAVIPTPTDVRRRYPGGVKYELLKQLGVEEMFKELFEGIRRSLAKGAAFPDDKLFFVTPLFDFGEGFVPAEIGNGFIRDRD